uniref:Coiled-coil domain-containing protein 53 n=1 Tax=Caenorhabditis tropicalis TaxID=1561998 RepID=A0A1I7TSL8_9PELO
MSSTTDPRIKREVDLNKVPSLDHHRTAVSFNCLILKMTELLNSFGTRMENVLERADQSLDMADRKLKLMEAKLSAVNLEKTDVSKNLQPVSSVKMETHPEPEASSSTADVVNVSEETVELVESVNAAPLVLIKDDPTFSKYFKMLKMGVPEAGVIQKMESEGIDPSVLKRGDEPSAVQVPANSGYDSSGESVSSFSDSD